jgi:hypothetical protein
MKKVLFVALVVLAGCNAPQEKLTKEQKAHLEFMEKNRKNTFEVVYPGENNKFTKPMICTDEEGPNKKREWIEFDMIAHPIYNQEKPKK